MSTMILESDTGATGVRWAALAMRAVAALFLLFDGVIHVARPQPVIDAFAQMGFPLSASLGIGLTELLWTALYVMPRTSLLGAVLLTGHLGGAVAAHLRAADAPFPTYVFPALLGALIWGGLWLRDPSLRALLPLRRAGLGRS